MKRRSNLLLFLLLNVLVSAATTLTVLMLWDRDRAANLPAAAISGVAAEPGPAAVVPSLAPEPTETNPPPGQPVIEIVSVAGAGDIEQEVVVLKRIGEGKLRMAGWRLQGLNDAYVFPMQPELVLYKDGAVQVYSRLGSDTVTDVYWNRSEPAWRSGETVRLLDSDGSERAIYRIP